MGKMARSIRQTTYCHENHRQKAKTCMLLHYAGPDVDEIFDTLQDTGDDDDYDKAVEKLNQYFSPKTNTTYEVYNFRQAKQKEGESLDSFHTRLRKLSKHCAFADTDKEIKEQIILSCSSNALRRKALREDPDLANLLKTGRAFEISETQAKEVEKTEATVNAIRSKKPGRKPSAPDKGQRKPVTPLSQTTSHNRHAPSEKGKCSNCGGDFPHRGPCKAKGKTCNACGKSNHFARVCRSNPQRRSAVRNVTQDCPDTTKEGDYVDEEDDYAYTVGTNSGNKNPPMCQVHVDGKKIQMMVDSGASVDLLDEVTFKEINNDTHKKLERTNHRIYSYGSTTPLHVLGTVKVDIKANTNSTTATLHVVKGNAGNLLGCNTAQKLGLLKIVNQATVNNKASTQSPIYEEHKSLFEGIGKVKNKVIKLHIDPEVKPKQQPHRRIPFHVRKDVERELERLEKLDVIEQVTGPTPWVSPIVVVPKSSGDVRICVDMREANKAVEREKHLMPTIDDLVADLNGATVFSKLDLSSGYHQLELDPDSRHITTFSTHVGLRRYKRLMFGINAASEIFQNAIEEILTGLPGCRNISDDIIVFGKSQEEHDKNLRQVLERLEQHNVRLNKDKCSFSKSEIKFYGHVFSSEGVRPDPSKIEAIKTMSKPTNVSEVKSLLGMTQYVSRFIQEYATITAPLRILTRQDVTWKWEKEQQQAFDKLKDALTKDKVVAYFDPTQDTEVFVDASPVGLGALLVQNNKIISYASRALSDVECRYSQTEREMLAVVWATEHFHLYLYGSKFKIFTDHKPLLGIFQSHKPTSTRIDRWKLRLMPYNYQLVYRPGKDAENPADFMSRHPSTSDEAERSIAEDYVNYVCNNAVPKAMTLQEIKLETKKDQGLQTLISAIETDCWSDANLQEFKKVKDELAVYNGMVLRGNRIVVPGTLRDKAIELAHVGHQGIVKTKRLIREKVWFPGIDRMVKEKVDNCLPCQATQTNQPRLEPLRMTPLPSGPWKEVAVDFAGPFPSGDYLLVVIDEYSRFPEVEIVSTTSARAVIPKLDAIFSRQGIPDVLKSDNGPPFNGHEFKNFAEYLGFRHRKITPLWPKANGEAERFMRTLKKSITASHAEGKNWKQELFKFLRQYRATPHSSTNLSPCEALNQRKLKITLPEVTPLKSTPHQYEKLQSLAERDDAQKRKMKEYADQRANAKESKITTGEKVLIRQPKANKLSTPFNPKPFVVERTKGTMVTANNGQKTVTRNSSHFKVIPRDAPVQLDIPEDPLETQEEETLKDTAERKEPELRRSQRQRKPPDWLADYVIHLVYQQ